jgi:hypothetical protein
MPLALLKDRTISLTLEKDYEAKLSGTQAVLSNDLFQQFLPTTTGVPGSILNKLSTVNPTIILKGPNYMSFDHVADVAEENGLFTSFLQPWYIRPVNIQIRGGSYLGAYTLLSVPDGDLELTLAMFRKSQGDFSNQVGTPGDRQRVVLNIQNNPQGSRTFLGYFKRLTFSDEIKSAYLLDYQIDFVGRNIDNLGIATGKANAAADRQVGFGQVIA